MLKREWVISTEIHWINDSLMKRYGLPEEKQFVEIHFTGDPVTDNIRFRFAALFVHEMMTNKDTIHGIDIRLGEKCKYKLFIAIMDIFTIEHVPIYFPSDNAIIAYYPRTSKMKKCRNGKNSHTVKSNPL